MSKNPLFTNLKKSFDHIELPAKLLDYFLRSNKSKINQISICKSFHEGIEANQILVLILFPQVPLCTFEKEKDSFTSEMMNPGPQNI